ncbi:MAG: hypothetical protein ACOC1P_05205 [Minisyncoccales bacterium]
MEQIKKLELTEEEMSNISKIARDVKFSLSKENYLYPKDIEERFRFFIKAYDFLYFLKENIHEQGTKAKIEEYIKQYDSLYAKIKKILATLDLSIGKSRKINMLIDMDCEEIKQLIIDAFPIGRIVDTYDIDNSVGI